MSDALKQIRNLIADIVPGNRFYTMRLRADGVLADKITSLADFSRRVSFTHKQELIADQAMHPPYGSALTFPLKRYSRFSQTTGTTGRPLVWLDTAESWDWMLGNWGQVFRSAGVGVGDRIFFAFSFGPFLGFWTAFESASQLGCLCLPGGGLGTGARLRALAEHQVTVLLCTPTYALHLADAAKAEGIDFQRLALKKIIVAGEPGGSNPKIRERISNAWHGARVIDHYGMTEVGPVSYEDPDRPGVQRIIEQSYYAEVVHPKSGEAVADGGVGELVLTSLGRTGTPLIRYRTGDLVKRLDLPDGLGLDGGIIGRVDDMVVVRGVNIYPSAVDSIVRSIAGIGEYRVRIFRRDALCELEIEIESPGEEEIGLLANALLQAFTLRIMVRRVPFGTLPHFELKARRWINECF